MSIFSRVSKEAKILIGLTFLAGASLIWFNFFTQQRPNFLPLSVGSSPSIASTPSVPQVATETLPATESAESTDIATTGALSTAEEPLTDASSAVTAVILDGENETLGSVDTIAEVEVSPDASITPTVTSGLEVAAPVSVPQAIGVSQEIQIAELPFLITSPPSALADITQGLSALNTSEAAATPDAQRASINPFAPLVLVAADPVASSTPTIVDVPIPSGPQTISDAAAEVIAPEPVAVELIAAPPVRNVAPPGLQTNNLPRALPSGSLPTAPSILRQAIPTITVVDIPAQSDAPERVTVTQRPLLPEQAPAISAPSLATPSLSNVLLPSTNTEATPQDAAPAILAEPLNLATEPTIVRDPNVAVGASEMSRYLRDNNVRFTGSVVGPVSVAVFRANTSSNPIIVTLGSTFPDTDFVLTSLKGQQAEFAQGQTIQMLALDLN